MPDRQEILHIVAKTILERPATHVIRVGIDGVDGAGKTVFGDELAHLLDASGRTTIRASVDSFHNPQAVRYRLGRSSPRGYFLDSYDYAQLKAALLDPLSPGGTGRYHTAIFDHRSDAPVSQPEAHAVPGAILVFDGIFLHRPELRKYWDVSIFLEVGFDVSIPRGAQRGEGSPDPQAPENHRYVEGQNIYLRECDPKRYATMIINNEDLASPYIVPEGR
jgi:uridine kinase